MELFYKIFTLRAWQYACKSDSSEHDFRTNPYYTVISGRLECAGWLETLNCRQSPA